MKLLKTLNPSDNIEVTFYDLGANKNIEKYFDVNTRILRVTKAKLKRFDDQMNVVEYETEEKVWFYGFIGNEYTTKLQQIQYRRTYKSNMIK